MRNIFKITTFAALTLLTLGVPAYAIPVTIEFTGVNVPPPPGNPGSITVNSGTDASGNMAISTMIVLGSSLDGTYSVTGALGGFGDLTFNTNGDTLKLTGGVASLGIPDTTVLLTGTGPFSNVVITNPPCGLGHNCPFVSFDTTDIKDASLLTALGISGNAWNLSSVFTADGTGNAFPQTSADALNTQIVSGIPEPATLLLLGTGLFGLGLMRRRKAA